MMFTEPTGYYSIYSLLSMSYVILEGNSEYGFFEEQEAADLCVAHNICSGDVDYVMVPVTLETTECPKRV